MFLPESNAPSIGSGLRRQSFVATVRAAIRRSRHQEHGQSAVELALCLPILLLVLTGITTFGLAFNNYLILTEATNTGARALSISRGQTTDPCSVASAAVIAAAPTLTSANLTFAYSLNGSSYSGTSCNSASTSTGAAGNLSQGQPAQMKVTYPCSLLLYGGNYAPNCTLTAQTTELVQ